MICDNARLFDICALPILDQVKCKNIPILEIYIPPKLWINRIFFLKQCLFQINKPSKYNILYQTTWIPSIHTISPNACDIIYADIKWKSIIKYVVTFSICVVRLCIFISFWCKICYKFSIENTGYCNEKIVYIVCVWIEKYWLDKLHYILPLFNIVNKISE